MIRQMCMKGILCDHVQQFDSQQIMILLVVAFYFSVQFCHRIDPVVVCSVAVMCAMMCAIALSVATLRRSVLPVLPPCLPCLCIGDLISAVFLSCWRLS